MLSKLESMNPLTKIQYGLMIVFGGLTTAISLSPMGIQLRIMAAGTLFGITVGLWL